MLIVRIGSVYERIGTGKRRLLSALIRLSAFGVALTARTAVATTPAAPIHVRMVGDAFFKLLPILGSSFI